MPARNTSSTGAAPSAEEVIAQLASLGNERHREGMERFGINAGTALGVSIPNVRKIARPLRGNHRLALDLWKTGIHEARILASIIDDPQQVTPRQLDSWARAFNSWDVCDQCCINLFVRTEFAHDKAMEWSFHTEEFIKRAGFAMMAAIAVHDKGAPNEAFAPFLERIKEESTDNRNFVRKAVNWALRQIGKRNRTLNAAATETAREIAMIDSKAARWIASDALREFEKLKNK